MVEGVSREPAGRVAQEPYILVGKTDSLCCEEDMLPHRWHWAPLHSRPRALLRRDGTRQRPSAHSLPLAP